MPEVPSRFVTVPELQKILGLKSRTSARDIVLNDSEVFYQRVGPAEKTLGMIIIAKHQLKYLKERYSTKEENKLDTGD